MKKICISEIEMVSGGAHVCGECEPGDLVCSPEFVCVSKKVIPAYPDFLPCNERDYICKVAKFFIKKVAKETNKFLS